ncbi:hypothetical protein [Nonomuraea sp. bgisy101]|uniref:hypothetical protein n=1 Tax=Nonomuraea sp. bgisy101 TaxID=3413784 RepID=UPI003D747D80
MDQKERMPRPVDVACLLVTIQAALAVVGAVLMGSLALAGGGAPWIAWVLIAVALVAGISGWRLANKASTRGRRVLVLLVALEAVAFAAAGLRTHSEPDFGMLSLANPHLIMPVVVVGLLLLPSSARTWFDR